MGSLHVMRMFHYSDSLVSSDFLLPIQRRPVAHSATLSDGHIWGRGR